MLRWTAHLKGPKRYGHAAISAGHEARSGCCVESCSMHQVDVHLFKAVYLQMKLPAVKTGREECPLDVPSVRWGHAVVLVEDTVYIWGGRTHFADAYCNVLYAFDIDNHRWSRPRMSGTVPEARHSHTACVLKKVVYIFGGYTQLTGCTNDIYALDTATTVWSLIDTGGTFAPASMYHSATMIGTKMFVFGGQGAECEKPYDSVRMFDTGTNLWLSTPSAQRLSEGRWGHSAFAYNGELYIFGGKSINAQTRVLVSSCATKYVCMYDLWKFNPTTYSWKSVKTKGKGPQCQTQPRMCCCVVADHIVLFGGWCPGDTLFVLDLSPSLQTLCKLAVTLYNLKQSGLSCNLRWDLEAMTCNDDFCSVCGAN